TMARSRRQKLARTLSDSEGLTYQQALTWLNQHVVGDTQLPRTDTELVNAYRTAHTPRATDHPADLVEVNTPRPVMTFVMQYSSVARCPHLVMSVGHYLPTGECAHAEPTCPTCRGAGQLRSVDGSPVPCAVRTPGLARGVPVCGGT